MAVALSMITKYLITIMCIVYGISSVTVLGAKTDRQERKLIKRQQACMFAFHFASYLILFLQTENMKIAGIYLVQVLFFKIAIWLYQYLYPNCSLSLMNHMFFLLSIGFVMLSRISFDKAVKQFIIVVLAFLISLLVPALMDFFSWIPKLGYLYGLLGIVFLSLVFVIGSENMALSTGFPLAALHFSHRNL